MNAATWLPSLTPTEQAERLRVRGEIAAGALSGIPGAHVTLGTTVPVEVVAELARLVGSEVARVPTFGAGGVPLVIGLVRWAVNGVGLSAQSCRAMTAADFTEAA